MEPVPGIPPTAKHLLAVKKIASSEDLKPIVLSSNFYPKHVSQTFADDIDASFYYLSSNVSDEGIDTYIELFDYLVRGTDSMISLLAIPFLACIALVFVHVYFGTFVLKRGIIFIDLALAQWAAFGYLVSNYLHIDHSMTQFIISFGFTLIAGFILTMLKPMFDKVNLQEAIIGVVYITATTLSVILIAITNMEGHHLNEMLAGHLLFIRQSELIFSTGLYAIIAGALYGLHRYFLTSQSKLIDFLFYALFGLVVTSSVKMVGILLVFSFLVIPTLSTILFTKTLKWQLIYGWILGVSASFFGLFGSILFDIPPSFSIILVLIGCLISSVLISISSNFNYNK